MPTNCKTIFVTLLFVMLCASSAFAQSTSGMLEGIVQDSSGGVLPGASVRAINEDNKQALQTVTDSEGRFRFVSLSSSKFHKRGTAGAVNSVTRP